MRRTTLSAILLSLVSIPVLAQSPLIRFDGGIGSQPLRSGAAVNTVRGFNPGGLPWVIERLTAVVSMDGRITVDGRGLLLAGGDNVGFNGGQSVRAVLVCGSGDAQSNHRTDLVPLEPNGDFRFNDVLLEPIPPMECAAPVLLIVNAGNAWFAAGIPRM
jgi:hypothetical protein